MLFKRKEEVEERIETEEELEQRLQLQLKRQKQRIQVKKGFAYLLIALVVIGGLKSLFTINEDIPYVKAVNDYAFVEEYMTHYLHYPQNEEDRDYLELFALESWRCEYDQQLETADIDDLTIYHVVHNDNDTDTYYMTIHLSIQTKDTQNENLPLYVKMTLAQRNDCYLVIAPIDMAYTQVAGMPDEMKEEFKRSQSMEGEDCSDTEKQELEMTIQLFLKTYTADFEQARLLLMNPSTLDRLDPTTEISLEHVNSIRKTSKEYMIDADVLVISSQTLTQRRKYHFVIDQASNKILEMEEY